ncbi:RiPP maturation radical SAM protein 1 [Sphingomonas suaedae]|uniref:RiPP maturation radical SAM protein 1 n=1 Tax=Sphingomonas suaedae TaxID=2599297 RepID=A0A518RCD8_9SPHN|nr:RiPP maturation radical SAM C-methyltransferase [Sphingomonas suaedae]QDX25127.1 RiPP maturation radical SAM protein 1 [Sphingomonas suaedae]
MDEQAPIDVLLVNMPFSPTELPSTGLSLLAQCLREAGFRAKVDYPNLRLEQAIGESAYARLSRGWFAHILVGEWVFSRLLAPVGSAEIFADMIRRRFADQIWAGRQPELVERVIDRLPEVEAAAAELIDALVAKVGALRPRVVGFSSCFHQHVASLAAARRVKEAFPETLVVLGGSNCNGTMGLETFRHFPFLDAVVSGPGEIALLELVRHHLSGTAMPDMPGVYLRGPRRSTHEELVDLTESVAPEPLLDGLPLVDYDDYFDAFPTDGSRRVKLPIETSRGCWWGQKHHCVFCSENADSIKYRVKSSDRVIDEFRWLTERYPGCAIQATDEILDPRHIPTVMPELAKLPDKPSIYFSIKANIRKDELKTLVGAGTDSLQAGIESLDDDVLRGMRKGVTAIRNVQLLKWCRELGISMQWSILYGFPFERPQSYTDMAALLPLLTHLEPTKLIEVKLQRYSPLFREAARFGISDIRPDESYGHIYALSDAVLSDLAYWFSYRCERPVALHDYVAPLQEAAAQWRQAAGEAFLFFTDDGEHLAICDTRRVASCDFHLLEGPAREIYRACDAAQPAHAVCKQIAESFPDVDAARVQEILDGLVAHRLVMESGGLYLALAIELSTRSLPPMPVMARFVGARDAALRERQPRRMSVAAAA